MEYDSLKEYSNLFSKERYLRGDTLHNWASRIYSEPIAILCCYDFNN